MRERPHAGRSWRDLLGDERGAVFAEYVVLVILIFVACILAWNALHDGIERDAREEYVKFGYPPED